MDQLGAHHDIVVKEGGRIFLVEANAPYLGGEMDDVIGAGRFLHPLYIIMEDKVVFGQIRDVDMLVSLILQMPNQMPTQEASAARDRYSPSLPGVVGIHSECPFYGGHRFCFMTSGCRRFRSLRLRAFFLFLRYQGRWRPSCRRAVQRTPSASNPASCGPWRHRRGERPPPSV